ncbi:MAG: GGDEF domain-containing protein [Butyrivibrio sp.]|nr:GGDEF domain-containing protein [Butyrivibrio sp.]
MPFSQGKAYSYEEFIKDNRRMVNRSLNIILWTCILAGPAVAIGIKIGLFNVVQYHACVDISIVMLIIASLHTLLFERFSDSVWLGILALVFLDCLLFYMVYLHIEITLLWFIVPILSITFCDWRIYYFALVFNYVTMALVTFITAPYFVTMTSDYTDPIKYFFNYMWGFTYQASIFMLAGFLLGRHAIRHYRELIQRKNEVLEQIKETNEKLEILDSMAEIYDKVNLLNFTNNTEMSLRDKTRTERGIDLNYQTHTLLNQKLQQTVVPDQQDKFFEFTDISTVRSRLAKKKVITGEFIDMVNGWFRSQYIAVDRTPDGIPNIVIYTVSNIEEEKRREEDLIRISMTDELTRLYNRRCYDEDVESYKGKMIPSNLVIFSADVNGLKEVNDTLGHSAGDELIKGAAECFVSAIGNRGKVYRMGGDEFQAMVYTDDPQHILDEIRRKTSNWHGKTVDKLAVSVGFATAEDIENPTITDIEKVADERMYAEKRAYYQREGIDRRESHGRCVGYDRRPTTDNK